MPIKTFNIGDTPRYPSVAISGPVGAGKTTLASSMPGRGLIIDVPTTEGGSFVIPEERAKRIKGVTVEAWTDLAEVYWALAKKDEEALPGVSQLDWVAVDSITGLAQLAKEDVISHRDPRTRAVHPSVPTLQEWGFIGAMVGQKVPEFQRLPYAKIWIAQERRHGGYDDDPGPVQIGPSVTRAALLMLVPPMTLIGRLSVEKIGGKEHRVLTVGPPGGDFIVKARALPGRKLPNRILDPHLGQILRYLFRDGPRPKRAREESII